MEMANVFHGIVPPPYITRYTDCYANITGGRFDKQDAMIPDIHITDYPTRASKRDGFNHIIPAIIEIKGLRVTDNNYSLRGKAVERRAAKIPAEYIDKAKLCDEKFASETTQGNANNCGPFEQALKHFLGGAPLGIIIGGASEVNGLLDEILDTVA